MTASNAPPPPPTSARASSSDFRKSVCAVSQLPPPAQFHFNGVFSSHLHPQRDCHFPDMTTPRAKIVKRHSHSSDKAAPPAPVALDDNTPRRGPGRPAGSFKVKLKRPKLIDGSPKPRAVGRPPGSTKKALLERRRKKRRSRDAVASLRTAQNLPAKLTAVPSLQSVRANAQPSTPDSHQLGVIYTHDFSIISQSDIQRLAAAAVASAMQRSAEDSRLNARGP